MPDKNQLDNPADENLSVEDSIEYKPVSAETPGAHVLKVLIVVAMLAMLGGGIYLQNQQIAKNREPRKTPDKTGDSKTDNKIVKATFTPPPADAYLWTKNSYDPAESIYCRIAPPAGFIRPVLEPDGFANWLRFLPLRPNQAKVHLYNKSLKQNQSNHYAVIDLDTGAKNLQQCADCIIRLRAEYLFARNRFSQISFDFASGDTLSWDRWAQGYRPKVSGNLVNFARTADADKSYRNFRKYLETIFMYGNTASLAKQTAKVKLPYLRVGDMFIHPAKNRKLGHAVIVVDIAVDKKNNRVAYLLAQGFTPAMDMHILKNPENADLSPWYIIKSDKRLVTPEYHFSPNEAHQF